jgi:hypothetical protein
MDDATTRQLELIGEIGRALDSAGVEWWLYGGWAMDFHAGRVTRDHSDIEFFAWARDAASVRRVLVAAGFAAHEGLHPDEGQPFTKGGVEVGAWYLQHDPAGRICTPGRWSDWPWPDGSFDGPRRSIDDVEAPVTSLEGLLDMKTNFERHAHGAPRREKDDADIVLLTRLLREQRSRDSEPK